MRERESRIYSIKRIEFGKTTNLRKITFVCREKESYDKSGIGIWWKKSCGLGIIDEPNKRLKYFMFGITLFNIKIWLDFKWVGKAKKRQPLEIKDL